MSVSFRAVLSLWKPMGFMMSLRSVRMLYAIAMGIRLAGNNPLVCTREVSTQVFQTNITISHTEEEMFIRDSI